MSSINQRLAYTIELKQNRGSLLKNKIELISQPNDVYQHTYINADRENHFQFTNSETIHV